MNCSLRHALVTGLLALAPALTAGPRRPTGIYAVVNIEEYVTQCDKSCAKTHSSAPTAADIESYFVNTVYPDLLANQAVSGISLYETWARLNPNPPSNPNAYDWSLMEDYIRPGCPVEHQ
jgi:hypothetical protein